MAEGRQHYNVTLAILTLAGTAFALQQTMVIPALPALQHDLHTTTTWVTWVLTVFLLVASVATPVLGKLGDQYGKGRLLTITLAIFLAGCIGAAAAWNIWSLIAFRAVQGAGGAVFPLSFAIIRDEFPREKMGIAIGLISAVFGVGGGLGIVLSGVIVDHASWRWLFIVGSIAIAAAVVLVHRFVPESPVKTPSRVDFVGAGLMSVGLISMLLALTEGENWGWTSGRILALATVAVVFLVAWGFAELRVAEPMVDMRMLARRQVLFTNVTALVAGFAMFGSFVLVPNFVETPHGLSLSVHRLVDYGFDASATKAGLYLLPSSVALLFAGPIAGLIGRRTGSKWPLAIGMLLVAAAAGSLALWHHRPWQVLAAMPVLGAGIGFAFAAMATLITEAVRPTETGVATGMNTVMRTVGGVIGGQVGAALLSAHTIPGTRGIPSVTGFTVAFGISAVAALVGAGVAVFVTPPRLRRRERLVVATTEVAD
ncbi:MAG: MFS transporter [Actinobacteria bacterium]|nr:MAG: MFS transporter [Actinomycetota bacterium]